MNRFFTRERFGHPQFIAGLLLLAFLLQCLWLVQRGLPSSGVDETELARIEQGLRQWHDNGIAGTPYCSSGPGLETVPGELGNSGIYDRYHSPLWYLTASAPLLWWGKLPQSGAAHDWKWPARAPYLAFGILLGASLWYVSRRLYGNMGGYIALTLYCFSPAIIRSSSLWFAQPEMGGAWGAFGAVFTAIAVAHTLYAPREVVLWNWRRIGLLGLSLALAIGSQFSLILVLPLALAFMLYVAPTRRGAALAILLAGCILAALILFAAYSFHVRAMAEGMRQAHFLGIAWPAFFMRAAYRQIFAQLAQSSPALVLAFPTALAVFFAWRRTRYFGNIAPLTVAVIFLMLAVGTPHYPGLGFQLMALPFMFVFVAGVTADLLETPHRALVMSCVWGLLSAQGLWNLWELGRIIASMS